MNVKSGIASNYLQINEKMKGDFVAMSSGFDREIRFEIVEHIGILSGYSTGWNKELNLVSWNEGQPKYDIRDWSPDHQHMSRGVTLHEKEMRQIFDLMRKRRMESRMESRMRREGYYETDSTADSDAVNAATDGSVSADSSVCDMAGSEKAYDMTVGVQIEENTLQF